MIPEDFFRKIRLLELQSRKLSYSFLQGPYRSAFKGHGLEFEEERDYQMGEDARLIDWKATARLGRPFVKLYREERDLPLYLVIDQSQTMAFGSHFQSKQTRMHEIAATLAFSAIKNQDRVGLLLFGKEVEHTLPLARGKEAVLRLLRDLLKAPLTKSPSSLVSSLEWIERVQKKTAIVLILSDFLFPLPLKALRRFSLRFDVIALRIRDPMEWHFQPEKGLYVEGMDGKEGGFPFDSIESERLKEDEAFFKQALSLAKVPWIDLRTDEPYLGKLIHFFRKRSVAP